jgi:hypothetical protein
MGIKPTLAITFVHWLSEGTKATNYVQPSLVAERAILPKNITEIEMKGLWSTGILSAFAGGRWRWFISFGAAVSSSSLLGHRSFVRRQRMTAAR